MDREPPGLIHIRGAALRVTDMRLFVSGSIHWREQLELPHQWGRSDGKPSPEGGGATGEAETGLVSNRRTSDELPIGRVHGEGRLRRSAGLGLPLAWACRSEPGVVVLCPGSGLTNVQVGTR